jgi:transcription initiation factor TFIID subunit 12
MNGNQPPQGQQVQQLQQPQQRPSLFRPEQMRNLPDKFTAEEKKKWENGLALLYGQVEKFPPESQQHQDAKRKITDFSLTLHKKMQQTGAIRPQVNSAQARPSNPAPAQQQQGDGSHAQPVAAQPSNPQQSTTNRPSEQMLHHVNNFPYALPSNLTAGTPEAAKFIQGEKGRYMKALMAMEAASHALRRIEATVKERMDQGKPLSPDENKEYHTKKEGIQKSHAEAKRFIETFRRQQDQQNANSAAASNQQAGPPAQQPQAPNGVAVPPRPTMNLQQQAPSQAMQTTEAVQAAMQAARNQQMNGGRPSIPNSGHPQNEQAAPNPAMNVTSQPNSHPGQGPQGANIKVESVSQPHINTNIPAAPHMQQQLMQQRQAQNSPHSAVPQSATSVSQPKPLSHQDAVAHAARTYSSSQTASTPNVMASHSHPNVPRETQNIITNKMPIPKQLPPGAIGTPPSVPMQPARPTYSGGPSNAGSGPMGQPAIQKTPGFQIEGDGDRVLNKRKLDELFRQVTGGGEGLDNSEGLTPEVEDVSLTCF